MAFFSGETIPTPRPIAGGRGTISTPCAGPTRSAGWMPLIARAGCQFRHVIDRLCGQKPRLRASGQRTRRRAPTPPYGLSIVDPDSRGARRPDAQGGLWPREWCSLLDKEGRCPRHRRLSQMPPPGLRNLGGRAPSRTSDSSRRSWPLGFDWAFATPQGCTSRLPDLPGRNRPRLNRGRLRIRSRIDPYFFTYQSGMTPHAPRTRFPDKLSPTAVQIFKDPGRRLRLSARFGKTRKPF